MSMSGTPEIPEIITGDDLRGMSLTQLKQQLDLRMKKITLDDLKSSYPLWEESMEAKVLKAFIECKDPIKDSKSKNQLLCSLDALDEWKSEERRKMVEAERQREINEEQEKRTLERQQKIIVHQRELAAERAKAKQEEKKDLVPEKKPQTKPQTQPRPGYTAEEVIAKNEPELSKKKQNKQEGYTQASVALSNEKRRLIDEYKLAFYSNGMIYLQEGGTMPDEQVQILIRHIMHLDKLAIELAKKTIELHQVNVKVGELFSIAKLNSINALKAIYNICDILHIKPEGTFGRETQEVNEIEKLEIQFQSCLSVGNEHALNAEELQKLNNLKIHLQRDWGLTPKDKINKLKKLIDNFNQNSLIQDLQKRKKVVIPTEEKVIPAGKELTVAEKEILAILQKEIEDVARRYQLFYGEDDSKDRKIIVERMDGKRNTILDNTIQGRLNNMYSLMQKIKTTEVTEEQLLADLNIIKNETEASRREWIFISKKSDSRQVIEKAIKVISDQMKPKNAKKGNVSQITLR